MDSAQLTRKQNQFLTYILDYREENGIWPTYREIAEHFGYRSPNSVTQNIQALIRKGVLVRTHDEEYELSPAWRRSTEPAAPSSGIPIRGLIAAGYLQEAVEADLGTLSLETLFPHLEQMFALRVTGMSMRDVGIEDGDFVLLMDTKLRNGEIGAVMYNGETSLKKVYFDADGLRLEPANEAYDDIVIKPDLFEEVRVIGKYLGHMNPSGLHKHLPKRLAG